MSERYRFRPAVDEVETYADGTEVPHRFSMIERELPDGTWEPIGFAEIQLRKVLRDESGTQDLSIGFAGLVNPELVE